MDPPLFAIDESPRRAIDEITGVRGLMENGSPMGSMPSKFDSFYHPQIPNQLLASD